MSASPVVLCPRSPAGAGRAVTPGYQPRLALAPPSTFATQHPQAAISVLLERRDEDALADRFTSLAVAPNETVQSVKLRVAQTSAFTSNHMLVLGDRTLLDSERMGELVALTRPGGSFLHVIVKVSDIDSVSLQTSAGRTLSFNEPPALIRRSKSALTASLLDSPDRSPRSPMPPCRNASDSQLALVGASSVPDSVVHLIIQTKSAKIGWRHKPGAKLELSVAAEATAETVAKELEAEHDLPAGSHQLMHNGQVLHAARSLASYGIDCGSAVLELVPLNGPSSAKSGSPPLSSPQHSLFADWQAAQKGLAAGVRPLLATHGSGGSYFLSNSFGNPVAVLKPADEEPFGINNPRSSSLGCSPSDGSGLRRGVRPGEGAVREVAAFVLDHGRFAGVPPTAMVQLPVADGAGHSSKLCSLQQYVHASGDCEERGVSLFPVREVHKIAQLDMRLGNADRNGSNILCRREDDASWTLIPIDHGYTIPDRFADLSFEWLNYPQAHVPFDDETRAYIAALDAEKDLDLLAAHGLHLRSNCKRVFCACTMVLQMGAARGLTPFAIGSIMCRELRLKSPLEKLHARALQLSRDRGVPDPQTAAAPPKKFGQHSAYLAELARLLEEYMDEIVLDGVLA